MSELELTHRMNRIIGQLEAIKKTIQHPESDDCIKTIQQLKASINGLKKFGEHYIQTHLSDCMEQSTLSKKEIQQTLSKIISSTFSF